MSENYKYQASFKFGIGQTGMLNVRAESPEEFKAALDGLSATDILGDLSGINATIKALDVVEQAGLQPTVVQPDAAISPNGHVTPLQQYQQPAHSAQIAAAVTGQPVEQNPWTTPQPQAAVPQVPAVANTPAGALPVCIHGTKTVISKAKAGGIPRPDGTQGWYAYACPAPQGDPTKCGLDFPGFNGGDMPVPHRALAKFL